MAADLPNATAVPSGENFGSKSPVYSRGAVVSCCFSPVSTESKKMSQGPCDEFRSTRAKNLPSGDQDSPSHLWETPNFRSAPPSAGIAQISTWFRNWRQNAMRLPSGDQVGHK